jgi:hypothetical protein
MHFERPSCARIVLLGRITSAAPLAACNNIGFGGRADGSMGGGGALCPGEGLLCAIKGYVQCSFR